MTDEWTFNGFVLPTGDVVTEVDGGEHEAGLSLIAVRATRQTLGGMAEHAGRLQTFEPPSGPRIVTDGSPNGENTLAVQVPDRANNLMEDGFYVWRTFSARAQAGLADRIPLSMDLVLVAAEAEAEGVTQGGATLVPNDFTGTI